MERTFKIRTKSNTDLQGQYPSERRYSASIVIGLSVVYFQLFLYSILLGTLIIHKMTVQEPEINISALFEEVALNNSVGINLTEQAKLPAEHSMEHLQERVEKDLGINNHYYIKIPALVCAGCFVMSLGTLFSFVTGVLAWKQWYIDHNITFFFLASSFSSLTSAICFLISVLTTVNSNMEQSFPNYEMSPITLGIAVNVIILSAISIIWSFLSTNIAYKGMRNKYPDEINVSKAGGHFEISTVRKGSKTCSVLPPDIVNHFPVKSKIAKYLPKKESNNLPKAESNFEYQQRVKEFLSGEPENSESNK